MQLPGLTLATLWWLSFHSKTKIYQRHTSWLLFHSKTKIYHNIVTELISGTTTEKLYLGRITSGIKRAKQQLIQTVNDITHQFVLLRSHRKFTRVLHLTWLLTPVHWVIWTPAGTAVVVIDQSAACTPWGPRWSRRTDWCPPGSVCTPGTVGCDAGMGCCWGHSSEGEGLVVRLQPLVPLQLLGYHHRRRLLS